jgi:hypothetical protein
MNARGDDEFSKPVGYVGRRIDPVITRFSMTCCDCTRSPNTRGTLRAKRDVRLDSPVGKRIVHKQEHLAHPLNHVACPTPIAQDLDQTLARLGHVWRICGEPVKEALALAMTADSGWGTSGGIETVNSSIDVTRCVC